MTEKQLELVYQSRKGIIFQILEFIEKHKSTKDKINVIENAKALINNDTAKEKIRLIFIDCINAAGGNNLTRNGKAAKYFHSIIDKLSTHKQIEFKEFLNCFSNEISNYSDLYEYLHKSKNLVNFGKKKAALFIYKLDWIQKNLSTDQIIFKNYKVSNTDLTIPLDIVIVIMLNKILGLKDKFRLDQYKDFDLINSFFKTKIGDKFILIEDLWFWGFFSTKGSGIDRIIEFNEDKFYTSVFLKPTKRNKQYILEFLRIIEGENTSCQ